MSREELRPVGFGSCKLAVKSEGKKETRITVGGVEIGGRDLVVIAGPCAIENREDYYEAARAVKRAGANMLRAGAFKPRTSPYSFGGLGLEGLKLAAEIGEEFRLPTVGEVMDASDLEAAEPHLDIIQVGSRNMHNFSLLRELGRSSRPVLLKRGFTATYEEFLMAAEYILVEGNPNVILCERGVRTFIDYTRNTLDIAAIPVLKELSHLPVIADPSHGTGRAELVTPLARAAVAAGVDGLIIEVHPEPSRAKCDGIQSLTPASFSELMLDVTAMKRYQAQE